MAGTAGKPGPAAARLAEPFETSAPRRALEVLLHGARAPSEAVLCNAAQHRRLAAVHPAVPPALSFDLC